MRALRGISWIRLIAILLTLSTAGGLRAQANAEERQAAFDKGRAAYEDGLEAAEENRLDDAIAAFRESLRLLPRNPDSAYNIACAYSRKEDVAAAVEWLGRAADWGFEDLTHLLEDTDLKKIRTDARYLQVVEDIQNRLPSSKPRLYVAPERPEQGVELVAMLRTELGSGAGFLISHERDRVYIATANHVVRQGVEEAKTIEVQLKALAPRWHRARLLPAVADSDLDLAFLAVDGIAGPALDFCALPLALAGDISRLRRGDAVYPVGYPSGILWATPLTPDHASQVTARQISFESQFVRVGFSGGALLNQRGEIVGMITADEPPLGRAVPLPLVLEAARTAGYPVQLSAAGRRTSTPLHVAARTGDASGIRALLENCADPNAADANGRTPLHEAAVQGSGEIVRLLVRASARLHAWAVISAKDSEPEFAVPLHLAAEHGHVDAVKALLLGGDVNVETLIRYGDEEPIRTSSTPLHFAAQHDHGDVAEVLIAAGADLEAFSTKAFTPLGVAAASGSVGAARVLLQRGAAVWPHAKYVFPLHVAAEEGKVDILRLLIEHGADVNHTDSFLATPLHAAVARGQVEAAAFLISQKAAVNAPGYGGNTPLHTAAKEGSGAVVELLLANGAHKNARNEHGETPIALAAERKDVGSLQALVNTKAESDGDVDLRDEDLRTPLYRAAASRNLEGIRALLSHGARVNAADKCEATPLWAALDRGRDEPLAIVEVLVAAGADVNVKSCRGTTPLDLAKSHGYLNVQRILLEKGANP
jgi:ankyrin repeat protein/S1-C subfamily serine protease